MTTYSLFTGFWIAMSLVVLQVTADRFLALIMALSCGIFTASMARRRSRKQKHHDRTKLHMTEHVAATPHLQKMRKDVAAEERWKTLFGVDNRGSYIHTFGLTERKIPEIVLHGMFPILASTLVDQAATQLWEMWQPGVHTIDDLNRFDVHLAPPRTSGLRKVTFRPGTDDTVGGRPDTAYLAYGPTTRHAHLEIPGWPCPPCADPNGSDKPCSCTFPCWSVYCDEPDYVPEY